MYTHVCHVYTSLVYTSADVHRNVFALTLSLPDPLPMVSMVTVTPVPSPRPSLRVSWTNPSSDCYTFSSHTITCSPRHGDTPPSNTTSVPGPTSSADVTLGADSAYFCFVNSTIADRAGGEFPTMTSSDKVNGFTYPNREFLTHPPTHTHPLTHSHTHPLTHTHTHPLTHSHTHTLTHSPTQHRRYQGSQDQSVRHQMELFPPPTSL